MAEGIDQLVVKRRRTGTIHQRRALPAGAIALPLSTGGAQRTRSSAAGNDMILGGDGNDSHRRVGTISVGGSRATTA